MFADDDINKSLSEYDIEYTRNSGRGKEEWSLEEVKRALSLLKWRQDRHHHQVINSY